MLFGDKKLKIGLALGSGGIKGLAHLAVIEALEKNNIPVNYIAGSSIGALIGGFYAANKNIGEIKEIILSLDRSKMFSLFFDPCFKLGLIAGDKLKFFLQNHLGKIKFSDLKIPFCAVSTDLISGETVEITQGDLVPALLASISIPLVLKPQKINNQILVDGGVSQPVPVSAVKKLGADFIIAVNLYKRIYSNEKSKFGLSKVSSRAFSIMTKHLASENAKAADFTISPELNYRSGIIDLFLKKEKKENIFNQNKELMLKMLPELNKEIKKKSAGWLEKLLRI